MSARSVPGVDIGRAIQRLAAEGLIARGGGHAMAAGLTVDADAIPAAMARLAELLAQLFGDALGDRAGGDAPRLRVADDAGFAVLPRLRQAELEEHLRQLGRLAGAGLARDDDDLVLADRLDDVIAALGDGEGGGVCDVHGCPQA